MGLLNRGSTWLSRLFDEKESRTVQYVRGQQTISLQATPGETDLSLVDLQGMTTTSFQTLDFIITAENLDFGAGPVEPELVDKIIDQGRTYQVLDVPGGRHFRYSDPDRVSLRIHTKLVEA